MKDAWDKFKISSDALKANWPLILMGLTALSSGLTNLNQYFIGEEDDLIKNAMAEQITVLADTYVKSKPEIKTVTVKSTFGNCGYYLNQHLKEYH